MLKLAAADSEHFQGLMEAIKTYAQTNQWQLIWTEIALVLLALTLLIVDLFFSGKNRKVLIPSITNMGLLALLGVALGQLVVYRAGYGETAFGGLIVQTPLTLIMRVFFLLSALCVSFLATIYLRRQSLPKMEFYHLILVITASILLLIQSNQFVLFFVALETVTIGFYILVGYCRTSSVSLEAGLKYLVMGGVSSAFLLFGIVLLYGVAGLPELQNTANDPMNFHDLGAFISFNYEHPLVIAGALLVFSGVAFKIGVVPFQFWIPDVYQGAPTPTAAFLAISSKAAGFIILINLIMGPFLALREIWIPLLSTIAILTILFGNLAPLTQRNVKRVIGLSGVAHAGYLLAGVVALISGVSTAQGAIIFYLYAYMIASFTVFAVMTHVAPANDDEQEIEHYQTLLRQYPLLGIALMVGLGSLAGIPPLAGFIGKWLLFLSLYEAGLYSLLLVAIIGVVISIFYYFSWMREATFAKMSSGYTALNPDDKPPKPVWQGIVPTQYASISIALLLIANVLFGLYQGGVLQHLYLLL